MKIASNERITVYGKTQSGKSHWAKKFLANFRNVIVYDLKREYGFFGAVVHDLEGLKKALSDGCERVTVQPFDPGIDLFDEICGFIFMYCRNVMFVVDEVQNFCSPGMISLNFKRILCIGQGAPSFIGVMGISQRPANVHNDLKGNASLVVCFRLVQPLDANALAQYFDPDLLMKLPKRWFYAYYEGSDAGDEVKKYSPVSA